MKPFDANGAFLPAANEGSALRRLAVRGAGVTVLSGGLTLAIQIVATVVLARMLAPRDFGLVAMVTTFSLLLSNFGSNGSTVAVIQREDIDHFLASNLFWANVGSGLLLTVGFAAVGSLLAWFYTEPRLAPAAVGVSLTIFLTSISVLHLALLKRAMHFSVVSANDIVSRAVMVVTSILLAWAGCGYWALVAGVVAQALSISLGAFLLCRWVPSLPRRVDGTASMVRFALRVYGWFSVNYGTRNMDNVLVGWRFSAPALGFYKKAYDLFALTGNLLVSSLTAVGLSALSRFSRDSAQFKRHFLGVLGVMAFVGMGLGADLALVGKDLIRLLLGPRWEESGRIFSFFGPGIGIMLLYGTHGWIHLSIGKPERWFRWGIVEFAFTVLLFLVALPWGPVGIAVGWTASFWILTIPAFWYAGKPIQLGVTPVLAAIWKYVVASTLAGCACAGITPILPPFLAAPGAVGALARVMAISLLFVALYLAAVILLHQGFGPLYKVAGLLREMITRARLPRPSPTVGPVAVSHIKESA